LTTEHITHKIAIVIPTKNRPIEIRNLLTSIENQTRIPDQIIIVDGGDISVSQVVHEFPLLDIKYIKEYPPSLARQRNIGMESISESITLAGYLDDDIKLDSHAIESMVEFWSTASPKIGGARFNILNEPAANSVWLKRLFLIDSKKRGTVLKSGFQTSIGTVQKREYVDWLSGGATIWRQIVTEEFKYDEWYQGLGYLEDLDYSYRVGQKYHLVVVPDARLEHFPTAIRNEISYLYGKWQILNRLYFAKKFSDLSIPLCCWSFIGLIGLNIGKGVMMCDIKSLKRAAGNLSGLALIASGQLKQLSDINK